MSVPGVDLAEIESLMNWDNIKEIVPISSQVKRMRVRYGEFNGHEAENVRLSGHADNLTWEQMILRMDQIRVASSFQSKDSVQFAAATLLRDISQLPRSEHNLGRLQAICRKLNVLEVLHFPENCYVELVDERRTERLGTGTYAAVDSVRVGHELYARKSIPLPRFRQQQVRDAIQNELSIVRALDHPHIVKVFFTYETASKFSIVMEPLADCDLEAYLLQHSSTPPSESQIAMVRKWLCCLSNTLAFIHSKDIRHKDIKSRNILVKGENVIFADFGSSHAFLDGGDSTTEGPSYGHTRMYCAPEVIVHQRRNRSADVFSLGCVFTELAVWLVGEPGFDINAWHAYRTNTDNGLESNAYHASLGKVAQWLQECDRPLVFMLYEEILAHMLNKAADKRLTAAEVSLSLQKLLAKKDTEPAFCKTCDPGLWISDGRFPMRTVQPNKSRGSYYVEDV